MRKCTLRAHNRITAKLSSLYPHWWVQGQLTPMNKGEMEIRNMRLKSPAFRVTGLDTKEACGPARFPLCLVLQSIPA